MREMKDSGISWVGEIPKEWSVWRNKYIFKITKDIVLPSKNYQLLSLTTTGIKEKDENDNGGKVPENYDGYQVVKENDLVMCLFDLDCSAVFSGLSPYNGMISPAYKVLKVEKRIANEQYYRYWFNYVGSKRFYKQYSKSLRFTLNADEFNRLFSLLPPLAEQQRIAEVLDRECGKIDGLKADIQAQIDTLEQYKRSVITEAVTHGLNPSAPMKDSGINYISEHPIHWSLRRLKYILNERNERSVTGTEELLSVSLYKGVIPSTEMTNRTMQADSLIGYKRVHKGDLVFNKLNPGLARFGCSDYDGITSPDFAVYIVNENYCNAKFLQYLLKTDFYVEKIKSVSMGVGDGFTRLYSNQLYEFFVALPPRDEVSIIINYLDNKCAEIEQIIADKKSQIETLDGYKKSLIYEYVTGKKEVICDG